MPIKEVKALKPKDKFFTSSLSGMKANAHWAEVVSNTTLRFYNTGTAKEVLVYEVKYKIIGGKTHNEEHTVLYRDDAKVTVPDRPSKLRRVWNELTS